MTPLAIKTKIKNTWTHRNEFTRAFNLGLAMGMARSRHSAYVFTIPEDFTEEFVEWVTSLGGSALPANKPFRGRYTQFRHVRAEFLK